MSDGGIEDLRAILVKAKALPVLFVGSGLSQRFLGTPSWEGLLEVFAVETDCSIGYYRSRNDNDLPSIATDIAENFFDKWWLGDKYSESRERYGSVVSHKHDPLKIEVSQFISRLSPVDEPSIRDESELLKKIHVHSVITTNWDQFLESRLADFEPIVGQSKILTSPSQSIGEIYKIHGSISDPLSITLTRSDYDVYWKKNPYLVAKIVTLFVEHPIIFFGYSLRDTHIQRILANIVGCLDADQLEKINDRLIFVGRVTSRRPEGMRVLLQPTDSGTVAVREIGVPNLTNILTMLGQLPQHYSLRMLRNLRKSVYDLAYWGRPNEHIQVIPFDQNADLDMVDVVIGMGAIEQLAAIGYRQFTRRELFLDMLRAKVGHAGEVLTDQLMASHFKSAQYAPLYYPLSLASRLDLSRNVIDPQALHWKAVRLIDGQLLEKIPGKTALRMKLLTFKQLLEEGDKKAIYYGPICRYEIEDVLLLRSFLVHKLSESEDLSTDLAKLACAYDRIVYGPGWDGNHNELRIALERDQSVDDYLAEKASKQIDEVTEE